MTQEEKQLVFKDICARLPYNVIVRVESDDTVFAIRLNQNNISEFSNDKYELTPYLRPMLSMTKEERKDFVYTVGVSGKVNILGDLMLDYKRDYINISETTRIINWLNAHHFDYRRLIEKGLALEYTKDCDSFKFDNSI